MPQTEKKKVRSEKQRSAKTTVSKSAKKKAEPKVKVEEFISPEVSTANGQAVSKRELIVAGKIKPLYCEVCDRVSTREFVGEWIPSDKPKDDDQPQEECTRKYWLRCTDCAVGAVQLVEEWKIQTEREKSLEELTKEECIPYSPQSIYAVGDAIFHEGLKEVGIVRSKVVTASGMNAISVEFRNLGFRQLLENVTIESDGTVSDTTKKGKLKLVRKPKKSS
ncbi:MAG: hypothetical protein RML35_09265 [Chloroherpetonaceae bacterium]|nr:hypothetical protein [Chloroherpetonaceae bacterium]